MTVLAMSHGELGRYDTLRRFERGELRIEDAVMLLGVGPRQVYRLLVRLRADEDAVGLAFTGNSCRGVVSGDDSDPVCPYCYPKTIDLHDEGPVFDR